MSIPPSIYRSEDYPQGPSGMARLLEDRIEELEALKHEVGTSAERRPINKQIHTLKGMLRWCKTRQGYAPDV